ncbi:Enoyl-[acyl-carrier-protein] reductase [NADH] [hydrothermal vent metagenome]|uniref:Enoyl-[acyl-carrier-protein] reductase [NADH] n=1 Tax=hydrothermal vent metagenome TaxID=652676 RepID=A0A3B0Y108_9ZZZZ
MGFLKDKKVLIVGLASTRSIAWGVAQAMHREGADLAFTYQNDKLRDRVEKMASECKSEVVVPCDVSSDKQIEAVFDHIDDYWDHLDVIIHSVAFAPRNELGGDYLDSVTREGFNVAHEISSYSFAALAKAGRHMMQGRNGALLTLSYLGAQKAIPNYNVMGPAKASLEANVRYMAQALGPENIRVNAVSAGPIRTLAAAGISGFKSMMDSVEEVAPLRRNITTEEVGNTAAFLCSDLASGITGEITYVDAGYNIIGMSI